MQKARVFEEAVVFLTSAGGGVNFLRQYYAATADEKCCALVRLQIVMAGSLIRRRVDTELHLRENPDSVVIQERSLLSTADFARANRRWLEPRDLNSLQDLAFTSYCAFPPPRLRICLVADPATCLEKIATRGSSEEVNISIKYLEELDRVTRSSAALRGDKIFDPTLLSPQEVEDKVVACWRRGS